VFPEWPEALLVLVDEEASGALVLPPLPVPFDRAATVEATRESGFSARVSEGVPGRWKPAMAKAANELRSERGQRHRQQEAVYATLARGAADPDLRERGEILQRKQRTDETIATLRAKIGEAKIAARTSSAFMDPSAFHALEEQVRQLGLESQALQTRLGELKRVEKEKNRAQSRAESERFGRRFQAAARALLEPAVYERLLAAAGAEEGEGEGDGSAGTP
jgi:hypothetical protein